MNLYEELDKFRQVIPEGDHRGCGFHMYAQGEGIRKYAMRTLSESVLPLGKNEIREDTQYTDNDTMFFFRSRPRAQEFWGYALGIGLSEGEVVFDPTIDPRLGVGEYAVRVMPHVRDTKAAALLALFRKAQGRNVPAGQFWEWMERTGGALEVEISEEDVIPRSENSGADDPRGRASGRTVAELTQQVAGMRTSDVHTIATPTSADSDIPNPDFRAGREAAQRTFLGARRNVGPDADLVHDGTNGTPMNGGAGAVSLDLGQAPGSAASPSERAQAKAADQRESRNYHARDRALSEELLALGSGCDLGGIAQLAGLRG